MRHILGENLVWKSMVLYGFKDPEFKIAFESLININGVGPRLAIAILSQMAPDALAEAIVKGDTRLFKGISGVGPKTASTPKANPPATA